MSGEEQKREDLVKQQTALAERLVEQEAAAAAAWARVRAANEELASTTARLARGLGRVEELAGPVADPSAAQAFSDLVAFIADTSVQQALVKAGLPADKQAGVPAALHTVNATSSILRAREDSDMLDDDEALLLAEEALGPSGQNESAEERRTKVLAAKGRLQGHWTTKVRKAAIKK